MPKKQSHMSAHIYSIMIRNRMSKTRCFRDDIFGSFVARSRGDSDNGQQYHILRVLDYHDVLKSEPIQTEGDVDLEDIPPCSLPSLLLPSHHAWYIAHVIGVREPGEGRAALDNSRQTRHLRLPLCQSGSKPYLFLIFLFKLGQLLGHGVLKPCLFCVFKQGLIDWDETESALTGVGASSLEQGRKLSPHNTVMDYLSFIWTPLCFLM